MNSTAGSTSQGANGAAEVDSRIYYAASMHDEAEISAVLEVLRDPRGLWVGKRVNAMERRRHSIR
ncbi:MAG: hypothetical protein WB765_12695 [Acidimicrobiales bacterium]|jgi:hypothetical protein